MKNERRVIPRAQLSFDNRTVVIRDVGIAVDGVYTCVAVNRVGSYSTSTTVESLVSPEVHQSQATLILRQNAKNVTIDCYGYGKPLPVVTWRKGVDVIPRVSAFTMYSSDQVVQMLISASGGPWNLTNRLYLRSSGVTYQEAGNYTCEVSNGVGIGSVNATTDVLFLPEFATEPVDQIILENNNVNFMCNSTGVPTPSISWGFNGGLLPWSSEPNGGTLTVAYVQNNSSYEGNYTCIADSQSGVSTSTARLVVDVPPFVSEQLRNITLLHGSGLNLTCSAGGDPVPSVKWTKDGHSNIRSAQFKHSNSSLVIEAVEISDEGLYQCTLESRAGKASSNAYVEVQAPSRLLISPSQELKLFKHDKNVTADCHGYGKPRPVVKWLRNDKDVKKANTSISDYRNEVVQATLGPSKESPWNVTSRLYLRVNGVTYQDAGNYTCEVFNGVGNNYSLKETLQVFFRPHFVSKPKDQIALEGQNVTFPCLATGVPEPSISWQFNNSEFSGKAPTIGDGNLTVYLVKNNEEFEGHYTCTASSRVGVDDETVLLTVDVPPNIKRAENASPLIHSDLNLTCIVEGDPVPDVYWMKNDRRVIPRAQLSFDNRTLVIRDVDVAVDGVYTCVAVNRAGSYSTSATVESLIPPEVHQSQATLILRQNTKNVTIDCYGYGKPLPVVTWRKGVDVIPRVSAITMNSSDQVVQMLFNASGGPWNITSRLYLRSSGVTYQEAGNYTCEVSNGVGNGSVNATTDVLFLPEFAREPVDQIILENNKVTFMCNSTGVPTPSISWTFNGGLLPSSSEANGGKLTVAYVKNNSSYEGNYTCIADSQAGVTTSTARLVVDVPPFFSERLRNITLLHGSRLQLTCSAGGDPVPSVKWTKDGHSNILSAQFKHSNSSLVIEAVEISDEGLYQCTLESRAGKASSNAYVEVQAPSRLLISPSQEMNLLKHEKNVTAYCHGYGKPRPDVKWLRNGKEVKKANKSMNDYRNEVVQATLGPSKESPWNVISRLYLRVDGVTYPDAGNYTCEIFNGVGSNDSLKETLQVFFRPQFVSKPKDQIALQGQNVTFPCMATGVPQPSISWQFNNSGFPLKAPTIGDGNLTVYLVKNDEEFEGNYTCTASSRAGVDEETVLLTVDGN